MGTAFDIRDEYPFFSTTFLYPTEPECSHRSLSPLLTQQNTDINYQHDIHRKLEFKNFVSISIIYHNGNIWGILASERAQPGKSEAVVTWNGLMFAMLILAIVAFNGKDRP